VLCRIHLYLTGTRHAVACGSGTFRRVVISSLLLLIVTRHGEHYCNVTQMCNGPQSFALYMIGFGPVVYDGTVLSSALIILIFSIHFMACMFPS
jgi:hypothetical protein